MSRIGPFPPPTTNTVDRDQPSQLVQSLNAMLRQVTNLFANTSDPELNEWVRHHLISVAGADGSAETLDAKQFKEGLRAMGLDDKAVAAMVALGTPLQALSSHGDVFSAKVVLDRAGRNHPSASSGALKPDGTVSQEGIAYIKMFQTTVDPELGDVLTGDDLKRFMMNRRIQISRENEGKPLSERIRGWIGARVVMSGEFGPFLAVAGIPNRNGELVLPTWRLDELYDHKIFYRVRAERDAASLLLSEMGATEVAPSFRHLAAFAKMEGVDVSSKENLLQYAQAILQKRSSKILAGSEREVAEQVRAQLGTPQALPERIGLEAGAQEHSRLGVAPELIAIGAGQRVFPQSGSDVATLGASLLVDNPLDETYLKSVLNPRGLGPLVQGTAMLFCPFLSGSIKIQNAAQ